MATNQRGYWKPGHFLADDKPEYLELIDKKVRLGAEALDARNDKLKLEAANDDSYFLPRKPGGTPCKTIRSARGSLEKIEVTVTRKAKRSE